MSAPVVVLAVGLLGGLLAVGWTAARLYRDLLQILREAVAELRKLREGPEASIGRRIRELEDAVDMLPTKWDQIRRQAEAAESRARYHVRKALDGADGGDVAGLAQLAGEFGLLSSGDDEGSGEEGVPAMHPRMESEPQSDDWRARANAKKYGMS